MIRVSRTQRRIVLAASASAFILGGLGKAEAAAAEPADPVMLGEVVVTANKRTETLREISQSVTVLGGESLDRQQSVRFQDYVALVPGLSLSETERGGATVILRGVNAGGAASTVGVYVDETPFGSSSGFANAAVLTGDFDTFDLERVEVLRGPQGTLYGASSLGGVLRYITKAPDPQSFSARGQIGVETVEGGGSGWSATGVVNQPLAETAALRVSGFYRRDSGFIDSIGTAGSLVRSDLNDTKVYGGRASLLLEPTEATTLRLSAYLQNSRNGASSWFEADPVTLKPLYGRLTLSEYLPEFTKVDYRIYNATGTWDLGFASLLSATSYGELDQSYRIDSTPVFGSFLTDLYGDPATRPLGAVQPNRVEMRKFSQELRLSSPESETLEWLVGGYFTRETGLLDQSLQAWDLRAQTLAPSTVAFVAKVPSVYKEYAAFANATWHVTPRMELAFGGRISRNKQSATQTLTGDEAIIPGGGPLVSGGRSSESVFTYSFAPRFELSRQAAVYARVAKGYRPGGPNLLLPGSPAGTPGAYDSDTIVSYETGLKGDVLRGAVSYDLAVYYLDWKDIQLATIVNDIGVNANGGSARSKGAEATVSARPFSGLSLLATGAYIDAKLTSDAPEIVGGFKGDRLPYSPKWSGSLSADYEWDLSDRDVGFVGATLSLVGARFGDFDTGYQDTFGRRLKLPGYETLDLRAGVRRGTWSLEAFAKNVTNERGATFAGSFGGFPNEALGVGVIRPRTVGVTLGARY